MLIEHIKLINYRQFIGDNNYIEFSTDADAKATLVLAENTTGKTTILDAFHWAFYGISELKTIVNTDLAKSMTTTKKEVIKVEVAIRHNGTKYTIIRTADIIKLSDKGKPKLNPPKLTILFTNSKGEADRLTERDAQTFVDEIIPRDLFPYFFFKGEKIEQIGREISEGKNRRNSAFVSAIQSMLGFNWLYQERDDLSKLLKEYRTEITENSVDEDLAMLTDKITKNEEIITNSQDEIQRIKESIVPLKNKHDILNAEILNSENFHIADKQKRYNLLTSTLIPNKNAELKKARSDVFKDFSTKGYTIFASDSIDQALAFLTDNSQLGQGIPGMDETSIDFFLTNLICLCGKRFEKDSETYRTIEAKKAEVRPNSLHGEIEAFKATSIAKNTESEDYAGKFFLQRKMLDKVENELRGLIEEQEYLGKEITEFPDISEKKATEIELQKQMDKLSRKIGGLENIIETARKENERYLKDKANYRALDEKTKKLTEYEFHTNWLYERICKTLNNMESSKRIELEAAINGIFKTVFNIDINVKLDDNYGIQLRSDDDEVLEDFEDSTSQDAILAFAFIGGIIKLARNKQIQIPKTDNDEYADITSEDLTVEPYPLVMDAPSSSFDITRIESFCEIMPKIAEQVIFFIKDTDGLYVKKNLESIIGKEYRFIKETKYSTTIHEVL